MTCNICDDGTREMVAGGSRTWRDNNPGAIRVMGDFATSFAAEHEAIGKQCDAAACLAIFLTRRQAG